MIDRFSATWATFREKALVEIEGHRNHLENPGTTLEETIFLRGQIAALRWALSLSEPQTLVTPPVSRDTSGY